MTETAVEPSPPGSPSKRKRGAESSSPDTRRSKRGAAAQTVPTAFMESAAQPDQAGGAEATTDFSGVPAADAAATAADGAEGTEAAAGTDSDAANQQRTNAANAASAATAAAVLDSMFPQLNVPVSTEETFANQHVEGEHHGDASAYSAGDVTQGDLSLDVAGGSNGVGKRPMSGIQSKPAVGSEEWHKMRKDNHKEVERRRRETINEGINELAKIVPGCEKNKGSILQRAVVFITQLKENETQNIEKWTLEKLLTEQAIAELSASNDKLKAELERLYSELETLRNERGNATAGEEKAEATS
ncbi:bHLH factor, other [Sporothrix brasiliensis 5110]|uniref:BHLH factor, other n=1 Tax=Sporothrix brasiliensis 5110 TaxID=1398154 RepID=A0A0C2IMS1_9PEZI|nr:bHLH factor, other [Sporothrix brasiliensis 5110]KIH88320.1 bHLH factor, other [Sporothrix brasiliensis 5110]